MSCGYIPPPVWSLVLDSHHRGRCLKGVRVVKMALQYRTPYVRFVMARGNTGLFFAAFESIKEYMSEENLQVLTKEEALNIKENDTSFYVFDPFSGSAFDHLRKVGCRIISPQVIIFCIQHRQCIPVIEYPVYNMIMADVIISCTSFHKETKEEIHKYVQMMGGQFCRDLNVTVTHLIAGKVGSKKYLVAASLGIPIMLTSWIKELWRKSQENCMTKFSSINIEYFKCPLFFGCTICVSGLCTLERRAVQQLTTNHGGQYMGHLKMNVCTHLIVQEPRGEKYEFAKKWNIHCVTAEWFYHSIEKGFCQDEAMYRTEPFSETNSEPYTSTTLGQNNEASGCTLSDFCHIANIHSGYINEFPNNSVMNDKLESLLENLQNLDINALQAPMDLLNGCRIYLCGFKDKKLDEDKLRRLISCGGGVCLNQFNEDVTHIIVKDYDAELKPFWTISTHRPHILEAKWLLECFSKGYLLSEEQYIQLNYQPVEIPLSEQAGMKMNNSFSKVEYRDAEKLQQANEDLLFQNDNDDMIIDDDEMSEAEIFNNPTHVTVQVKNQSSFNPSLLLETLTINESLFSQKNFLVVGFSEEDESLLTSAIKENDGKILPFHSRSIVDYIVVPLLECEVESTIGEVVTDTWLITCIEQQKLFDPKSNPLFTPIPVLEGSDTPLENCILSFSQFIGAEKDSLVYLANLLGARVQEFFVHKDNAKNDMFASTHLIVKQPDGSKYKAAQKWGLPAVTMAWILETAKLGKRADEYKFMVGNLPKQE